MCAPTGCASGFLARLPSAALAPAAKSSLAPAIAGLRGKGPGARLVAVAASTEASLLGLLGLSGPPLAVLDGGGGGGLGC